MGKVEEVKEGQTGISSGPVSDRQLSRPDVGLAYKCDSWKASYETAYLNWKVL